MTSTPMSAVAQRRPADSNQYSNPIWNLILVLLIKFLLFFHRTKGGSLRRSSSKVETVHHRDLGCHWILGSQVPLTSYPRSPRKDSIYSILPNMLLVCADSSFLPFLWLNSGSNNSSIGIFFFFSHYFIEEINGNTNEIFLK